MAPLPIDPLACARLASALIRATACAPEHPFVLGTHEDLPRTLETIEQLLSAAEHDDELKPRVDDLRARWAEEAASLAL